MRVTLLKTIANFKYIQNEKEDQDLSALFNFITALTPLCANADHWPGDGCGVTSSPPGSYHFRAGNQQCETH
jgi:hypothetical protein